MLTESKYTQIRNSSLISRADGNQVSPYLLENIHLIPLIADESI